MGGFLWWRRLYFDHSAPFSVTVVVVVAAAAVAAALGATVDSAAGRGPSKSLNTNLGSQNITDPGGLQVNQACVEDFVVGIPAECGVDGSRA